jgi:beta-galactosidase
VIRLRSLAAAALLLPALAACRRQPPPPAEPLPALERRSVLLSGPWRFLGSDRLEGAEVPGFDDGAWAEVTVPHTWGERAWRRAWYRTRFRLAPEDQGKAVYLSFEGVATYADVYLNGHHLGRHRGAYTRFLFDATPHARAGENLLAVRATNHPDDTADSLPSGRGKQLYRLWGGIYRKAWLVLAPAVHVDPTDHASSGVYLTPTRVSAESADLALRVRARNLGAEARRVQVVGRLLDREQREVLSLEGALDLAPRASAEATLLARLRRPQLWSPAHPYLYSMRTELRAEGRLLDAVTERTGFRDFRYHDGRFTLNGEEILLRGVGKHQETEDHAAAVTDDELRQDFAHLQELGVNLVRLAHYPHAALEYDLADEQGLLVWAENGHSNTWKSAETGDAITREMVRQNYNHPSIVMWSVGNETGFVRVNRYADVVRSEDPHRLIAYASNTGSKGKRRYPLLDVIAHNTYRGWYRGLPWEFEQKALEMRLIAESGGGAVVSTHTDYAEARHQVDAFEPEEYRQELAEVHFQTVFRDHPHEVPLYLVWILRDFSIDKYKGRNTKGLLTYANFRKDAFYLYQAFLRPEAPLVHLASKTYFLRRGRVGNGIKAYSNREALSLTLNGVPAGTRRNGEHRHPNGRVVQNVFHWQVPLRPGRNEVRVDDGAGHADSAVVYYREGETGEDALLRGLRSSNAASPVHFLQRPVQDQWPFYYELDGSADNTFDAVPEPARGAGWIATPRLSKPDKRTELSFTLARDADVWVMATAGSPIVSLLPRAGFQDTGASARWRDNQLTLVPARLLQRSARAGDAIRIPAATADYVVLVKQRTP